VRFREDFAWPGGHLGPDSGGASFTVEGVNAPLNGRLPANPLLTMEEAAGVLRIGRSLAYQLAAEYIASGGLSGLPVIRVGGCLRVPRWALLELVLTGRVVRLCDANASDVIAAIALSEAPGEL
jgi:hypothetical protein